VVEAGLVAFVLTYVEADVQLLGKLVNSSLCRYKIGKRSGKEAFHGYGHNLNRDCVKGEAGNVSFTVCRNGRGSALRRIPSWWGGLDRAAVSSHIQPH